MLLWVCQDALMLQRICEGGEGIQEAEVETNKANIPDDVVDADIAMLEKFFTKDAWRAVQHAVKIIRNGIINFSIMISAYSVHSGTQTQRVAMLSM